MFSKNRYPSRIKCGTGFFGIMLWGYAGSNARRTLILSAVFST
jgi:hypothetical protein